MGELGLVMKQAVSVSRGGRGGQGSCSSCSGYAPLLPCLKMGAQSWCPPRPALITLIPVQSLPLLQRVWVCLPHGSRLFSATTEETKCPHPLSLCMNQPQG